MSIDDATQRTQVNAIYEAIPAAVAAQISQRLAGFFAP
jgi:hypothetical protein